MRERCGGSFTIRRGVGCANANRMSALIVDFGITDVGVFDRSG